MSFYWRWSCHPFWIIDTRHPSFKRIACFGWFHF